MLAIAQHVSDRDQIEGTCSAVIYTGVEHRREGGTYLRDRGKRAHATAVVRAQPELL